MRALDAITAQPWAITEEWLATIMAIAAREVGDLEAVEARLGKPLQNTRTVTVRGSAAVIPVMGPIFRRANLFTRLSGATSIEILAKDFTTALEDPAVTAIVLDLDSPGGEVSGVNELAQMLADARATKPVIAYVGSMAASAAYWIASACTEIVVDATAMLGSIGVVMALPSGSRSGEMEFTSSQSPHKRANVATSAGRSQVQALVDATAEVFVETVARNRNTTPERVVADFGAGGMLVGRAAVDVGMADRIGSLESVLAAYHLPAPAGRPSAPDPRMATPAPPRTVPAALTQQETPMPAPNDQERPEGEAPPTPTPAQQPAPALDFQLPPMPSLDAAAQTQLEAVGRQMQAAMQRQLEAQYKQMAERAEQEALQRFTRWQAEQEQAASIRAFAQHVTTPTIDRRHALPFSADQIVAVMQALPAANRGAVRELLEGVLSAGLVPFERVGADGAGEDDRDPAEEYEALVLAKMDKGMSRFEALRAVNRERPALYQAQQSAKKGRR